MAASAGRSTTSPTSRRYFSHFGVYAAVVVTTKARATGSCQRRRVRARRAPDQSRHGIATITDSRQSGTWAQPEKNRLVNVVLVASRAE